MKELPEYELLSAYLDGELPTEERARVEQLLVGNPAARQLLDEMRALSSTLQSLPVQKLDEDLSQRVLRMAERRMLSGTSPAAQPELSDESPQPASVAWRSIGEGLRRPRTWLWPAIALAVGLLLSVRSPEAPNPPVERQMAERQLATTRKAPRAAEAPSIQAVPSTAPASPAPSALAGKEGRADDERDASRPARPGKPADRGMLDRLAGEAPASAPPAMYAPKPSPATVEKKAAGTPPSEEPAPAPAAPPPASMANNQAPAPASQGELVDQAGARSDELRASKGTPLAFKFKAADKADADLPQLLVRCDITPEALKQQVVETFFTNEQLRRTEVTHTMDRARRESKAAQTKAESGRDSHQHQEQSASPDVSYVEFTATRSELLTLLAKLKARPDLFVSIPEPSQLGLVAQGKKASGPPPEAYGGMDGQGVRQQLQADEPAEPTSAATQLRSGQPQQVAPQAVGQQGQPKVDIQFGKQIAGGEIGTPGHAGPTYHVRVELRVVSPAESAKPAAAAAEPVSPPPAAPAAGKR
jgi:hypothetical protein